MIVDREKTKEGDAFQQPNLNPLRRILRNGNFTEEECNYLRCLKQKGYQIIGQIGRGGYGVVYRARSARNPQKEFAIKVNFDIVCRSTIFLQAGFYHLLKRKRGMSRLINVFAIEDINHIVLEYFDHNSVPEIFYKLNTIDSIRHYMVELLKGIKTLKSMGIYHRDIKPHNFLYNIEKKKGVIVDYGMAEIDVNYIQHIVKKKVKDAKNKLKPGEEDNVEVINAREELCLYKRLEQANRDNGTLKVGTESYCALESLLRLPNQGHECEIWSAGVMFLQFLTARSHFFTEVRIDNGEEDIKYLPIFIMELAQLFGPKELEQFARRFQFTLTLPEGVCRGDIRRLIPHYFIADKDILLAYDLLTKMLQLYPKARICVEDAFMHPFFDSIRKQHIESQSQHGWVNKMLERRFRNAIQKGPNEQEQDKIVIDGPANDQESKFIKWPELEPLLPLNRPPTVSVNNQKQDSLEALKKITIQHPLRQEKIVEQKAPQIVQKKQDEPAKKENSQKIQQIQKQVRSKMIIEQKISQRSRIVVDGDEQEYYLLKKKKKIKKQRRTERRKEQNQKATEEKKEDQKNKLKKTEKENSPKQKQLPQKQICQKDIQDERLRTTVVLGKQEIKDDGAMIPEQEIDQIQEERRRRDRSNKAIFRLLQQEMDRIKNNPKMD